MFDLLFAITDWLRTTALLDLSFWITETSISLWMVENFWNVPLAQVLHILSIAAAFGATLMLSLRVLGKVGMHQSMAEVAARYIPWVWYGLLFILISGTFMLLAEPLRNLVNAVFLFKMIFLVVTLVLSLSFYKKVQAQAVASGAGWQPTTGTRTSATLLIVLWLLIMLCGRWIAYVPV